MQLSSTWRQGTQAIATTEPSTHITGNSTNQGLTINFAVNTCTACRAPLLDFNSCTSHNARKTMLSEPGLSVAAPIRGASSSQEDYIQPSFAYGLRIWWAYYWPTSLISFFIIGILMVLLRRAWEYLILRDQVVLWVNRILPYAVTFFVSMFGIHRILRKKFQSFYIALLPRNASFGAEALPRTSLRALRVWWEFIWRSIVYSVIFRFAGSIALGLTMGILASIGGVVGKVVPLIFQVLIDAAVGSFVIYSGLFDEGFGDFRVTLARRVAVLSATPAVEPTAPDPVS